jgi:hypothetical protein
MRAQAFEPRADGVGGLVLFITANRVDRMKTAPPARTMATKRMVRGAAATIRATNPMARCKIRWMIDMGKGKLTPTRRELANH